MRADSAIATDATSLPLPNIRVQGSVPMGGLGDLLDGVYAEGPRAGTRVAVKRLAPQWGQELPQTLRQRTELAIGREHPNLLRVHELVAAGGYAFLVFEFLEGKDLLALRAAAPVVPEWVAVAIASQLLAGLAFAQRQPGDDALQGHLCPQYLLVCRDGLAKILDGASADEPEQATLDQHEGAGFGPWAFASPEHALGRRLDQRSACFELAASIYFLLTGASPFGPARSPTAPTVPIESLRHELSPALVAWFHRALAPAPSERFADAAAMLAALTEAVGAPASRAELAQWMATLPAQPLPEKKPAAPGPDFLPAGTKLGRYVVLEKLGQGGMGVVYTAYDPELDRRIALKLMRPRAARHGQERMLREAQAMAKVSHPNAVAVYDVGLIDGRVFLAMELVPGVTLTEWLKAKPRSWREVVDLLSAAGRGLAAAHDVGLAHRDFKPDNVLIGDDGRPRVTDFGLARRAVAGPDPGLDLEPPVEERSAVQRITIDDSVTRGGAIIGTPAYMAPEQRRGQPPDVRTDQFSFGVTLYQALYGKRPFESPRAAQGSQGASAVTPTIAEPPSDAPVPRWLAGVVMRALSERPEDRYPSMHALLEQLSKDPAATLRRRLVWAAGTTLVLGAMVAVGAASRRNTLLCSGAEQQLRGTWDEALKDAGQKAFLATGSPIAQDSWTRAASALEAYSRDWATMHRESCEATRVRGIQTEAVMALRMLCLDKSHAALKALTQVLSTADVGTVERAAQAASELPRLSDCADVALLSRDQTAPKSDAERAQLTEATRAVARVEVLYETGRYADGLAAAEALEKALGESLPRIAAENAYLKGQLLFGRGKLDEAIAAFDEAVLAAERGAYPLLAARAHGRLTFLTACPGAKADLAWSHSRHAQALTSSIGGDALAETWRLSGMACTRDIANDVGGSVADTEKALGVYTRAYGKDALYATLLTTFAASLSQEPKRALPAVEEAIATQEQLLGKEHPKLSFPLVVLTHTLGHLGRYDEAVAAGRRAIQIREANLKKPDRLLASAYLALAVVHRNRGALDEAWKLAQRGLQIRRDIYPAGADELSDAEVLVASILTERGELTQALPMLEAAVARLAASKDGTDVNPNLIDGRQALGHAYLAAQRYPEAIAVLERALAGTEKRHDVRESSDCRFSLAQALAVTPVTRARARELALEAERGFRGVPNPARADEVRRWLEASALLGTPP